MKVRPDMLHQSAKPDPFSRANQPDTAASPSHAAEVPGFHQIRDSFCMVVLRNAEGFSNLIDGNSVSVIDRDVDQPAIGIVRVAG